MPNTGGINFMEVTRGHIIIKATDGTTLTITKDQIVSRYLLETPPNKRLKTISWLKNLIQDTFGESVIQASRIDADFDESDGSPTQISFRWSDNE